MYISIITHLSVAETAVIVSWPFINPPTFPNSVNFWGCGPLFSNVTQKIQFSTSVISFYYRYFFIKNRFFLSVLPRFTYCGELCLPASFDLPAFTSETPRDSIFVTRSVLSAEKVLEPATSTDTVKAFNFLQVTDVSARSHTAARARVVSREEVTYGASCPAFSPITWYAWGLQVFMWSFGNTAQRLINTGRSSVLWTRAVLWVVVTFHNFVI